jgi:hypothetical protein
MARVDIRQAKRVSHLDCVSSRREESRHATVVLT